MVWIIGDQMGLDRLASQIQIGQAVWQIGRALLDVVSVWAWQQCRGSVESKSLLLWVLQRPSTWHPIRLVARHCGFASYWWIYLIRSWGLQWFTVTIRVASSSLRILYFTTGQSILRSNTISFVSMFREELWSCSTFPLMSMLQISWQSLLEEASSFISDTSWVWRKTPSSIRGSVDFYT